MNYVFDVDQAGKYGLHESIILANIIFWIKYNKANDANQHDGHYWTWNSVRAWQELFPFWTVKQVRGALASLIKQGVLIPGNYNKKKYDRTIWYALADESAFVGVDKKPLPSRANGLALQGKPIPLINTDINKKDKRRVSSSPTGARPPTTNKLVPLREQEKEAPKGEISDGIFDAFFDEAITLRKAREKKERQDQEREDRDWQEKRGVVLAELKGAAV